MTTPMPVGWGFAPQPKEAFDLAAKRLEEQRAAARVVVAKSRTNSAQTRRLARRQPNRRRCMHFALWCRRTIATTGKWPTVAQVEAAFDVDTAFAGALLDDFEFAVNQEWL